MRELPNAQNQPAPEGVLDAASELDKAYISGAAFTTALVLGFLVKETLGRAPSTPECQSGEPAVVRDVTTQTNQCTW